MEGFGLHIGADSLTALLQVVLWIGLVLSIVLMAIASNAIARILDRYHWIAWIGFAIILYVAGDMIWDGTHEVVAATGKA